MHAVFIISVTGPQLCITRQHAIKRNDLRPPFSLHTSSQMRIFLFLLLLECHFQILHNRCSQFIYIYNDHFIADDIMAQYNLHYRLLHYRQNRN